jgi:glycosyltransferase involved in cell wall biosynthesis
MIGDLLETHQFDVVWVSTLNWVTYLEQCFRGSQSRPVLVLDQQNVYETYYGSFLVSRTNVAWKLGAALEMAKARRLQKRWFPRFDVVLSVSIEDVQETAQYVDTHTRLWLAPNGVDTQYFQPAPRRDPADGQFRLVFVGSMDVTMNQDAIRWFVSAVMPIIRHRVSGVELLIVGRNPPAAIRNLAERPGITVTGCVPDVREYYAQADVAVVPLRLGGGTKTKTLEAMAMGLPVISTTVGAQGLEVRSGRHLYISDNPEVFSLYAVELLTNPDIAAAVAAEARRLVEQQYGWESIVNEVDRKLTDLLHKRRETI